MTFFNFVIENGKKMKNPRKMIFLFLKKAKKK